MNIHLCICDERPTVVNIGRVNGQLEKHLNLNGPAIHMGDLERPLSRRALQGE